MRCPIFFVNSPEHGDLSPFQKKTLRITVIWIHFGKNTPARGEKRLKAAYDIQYLKKLVI
jgi:hypothetical protein